jgi:hypothetical protein
MNKFYRFSPIEDEKTFWKTLQYITIKLEKLSKEILNQQLSINTLKIFPHYPAEYQYLYKLVASLGNPASFNSKTSFYVHVDEKIHGNHIAYLGVRIVDPYRMQVGCGDYEVNDFTSARGKLINSSPFIRDVTDSTKMIEVWHPDVDVLGYVVPAV